jgi:hypothetical protein
MGNTQLLLIILGVILVGIAIIVAMDHFKDNAVNADSYQVSSFLLDLATRAQKFYRTPAWLGGGGHSFSLLTADNEGISRLTNIPINEYGVFSILVPGNAGSVTLQGIGNEDGDGDGTNHTLSCLVTPDRIQMTVLNW